MKQERCPNCNGKLAIPDKKRGQSVDCPYCELTFIPVLNEPTAKPAVPTSKQETARKPKSGSRRNKPALRSIPVPGALAKPSESTFEDTPVELKSPDPLLPPTKSRLDTLAPGSKQRTPKHSRRPDPPMNPTDSESTLETANPVSTVPPTSDPAELRTSPAHGSTFQPASAQSKNEPEPAVAKIIKTEAVQTLLTKDGKLPTLQLKEDNKPKKTETPLSSNPLFVGLLVCASLVSSGLMLLMFSMQPSENRKTVAEARANIRQFYEVREDEELKPFQIELREAQLAHSRGDHQAEITAYQNVMVRFRAEDRNQYTGLTGSPTWDAELEELVTILLKEAKREKKSFLD